MRARMTTGLFKFEQCNLSVKENKLYVAFQDKGELLVLDGIKCVTVMKQSNGTNDVVVTTDADRFDFMLDGIEGKDVAAMLWGLTEKSTHLELRMD